ncbi:GNAT family N-acetyltransferase [Luteimonas sp. A611]
MFAAQRFYESRGYGGAAIVPSDFVVLAKEQDGIVGVGRLCQEQELLWLRGMQVEPRLQRQGIGAKILQRLDQEIDSRWCCCLPYEHLVGFYRRAGFEQAADNLPPALSARLANYLSRGLRVAAMVRAPRSRPNNSFKPKPLRGSA